MAGRLLSYEVSDLSLGKPPLRPLSADATVADALTLLRRPDDAHLSVWSTSSAAADRCCVGKVSLVDVLCFLCDDQNVSKPLSDLLHSPISSLLAKDSCSLVKVLEANSSILDAVDCILGGAQSLIVARKSRGTGGAKQKLQQKPSFGRQLCCITQEDVIRFLLNSINLFSPIPFNSLQSLNIIEKAPSLDYDEPALSALSVIKTSSTGSSAVAVLDDKGRLVGDISLYMLASCDETLAPAVATLSAGDLMAYIDYGGPTEDLIQLVKSRLAKMKLNKLSELLEDDHSNSSISSSVSSSASSSSEDEAGEPAHRRPRPNSGRYARGTEPIVCHPGSSLVAVMIQALSHRLNYVWVVEEDDTLIGVVTFAGMLKIFMDRVPSFS